MVGGWWSDVSSTLAEYRSKDVFRNQMELINPLVICAFAVLRNSVVASTHQETFLLRQHDDNDMISSFAFRHG